MRTALVTRKEFIEDVLKLTGIIRKTDVLTVDEVITNQGERRGHYHMYVDKRPSIKGRSFAIKFGQWNRKPSEAQLAKATEYVNQLLGGKAKAEVVYEPTDPRYWWPRNIIRVRVYGDVIPYKR